MIGPKVLKESVYSEAIGDWSIMRSQRMNPLQGWSVSCLAVIGIVCCKHWPEDCCCWSYTMAVILRRLLSACWVIYGRRLLLRFLIFWDTQNIYTVCTFETVAISLGYWNFVKVNTIVQSCIESWVFNKYDHRPINIYVVLSSTLP